MFTFDFSPAIENNRRALVAEILRRLEAALAPFQRDLDDFLAALFQGRLPGDWREQFHTFLTEQQYRGFTVDPHSAGELEAWIEAWARDCNLLPQQGPRATLFGGSPLMLAAFHPPADESVALDSSTSESTPESTLNDQGVELAGPGPETTESFRAKVQKALEILDPNVARWWRANSVQGVVRSRAAWFFQFGYYSRLNDDQPIIVVNEDFTAGMTAQAIIDEVTNGWFAGSMGAFYKRYRFANTQNPKELQEWQKRAAAEAARQASVLAELYVGSVAALTPAGDLVVTLGDLADNGPRWEQLLSVLPLIGHLPIGAIVLKLGKRTLRIRKRIAKLLEHLTEAERKSILTQVAGAKSDREAEAIVRREVARLVGGRQIHHAISERVYTALEEHNKLKGKFRLRDERFETLAKDFEAHHGYQGWHRDLDNEVVGWLDENKFADEATFKKWLRWRYSEPDLTRRFPAGFK